MKKILIFSLVLTMLSSCVQQEQKTLMPAPTNGETLVKEDMENPEKSNKKKEWLKKLFRTPEGMDAQYIELQNSYEKFITKNHQIKNRTVETFADGLIEAEWLERGSRNQSGSVFITEYDQDTKELYLISAGQHLWKGTLDGFNWQVVNQNARFHERFLDIVYTEDGTKRLLAAISNKPHYSDDGGLTWTASEGFEPQGNARLKNIFTTNDTLEYTYFLGQVNSNQQMGLYQTKNKGVSYEKIATFNTSDRRNLSLTITKNSNEVYVIEQITSTSGRLHKMNADQSQLLIKESFIPFSFNQGDGNVVSVFDGEKTRFYGITKAGTSKLMYSEDEGKTWVEKQEFPVEPWEVGLFVSAENPDFLIFGAVDCFRSFDGGNTWTAFNGWGDYYGNPLIYLHADMMFFSEYKDKDTDEHFMLISNHGGIYSLSDFDAQVKNISLIGLNVSQYYSVRTQPEDEDYIYAGSQDQGFQRGKDKEGEILDLGQAISGDYGHIVFTKGSLWTVYPGGWVSFWPNPKNGGIQLSYTIESSDEAVWIPPLATGPDPAIDQIYMAGGNVNGGSGSYLIRLTAVDQIFTEQIDYNFKANSGGTVSAIAVMGEEEEHIYVATDNGKFFYSHDYGDTFTKTDNVNGAHYLYGSVIIPSKLYDHIIYTGGTGYNGIPVMRSLDGGETFQPFGDGLPNTTVLGMAMNEDESLIFAATSSGPYVCIVSQEKWYSIMGETAPDVTYWSVELVNDGQTARFGTYGRGIFDFNLKMFVGAENIETKEGVQAKIYPNPVVDYVNIEWPEGEITEASIFDITGKLVQTLDLESKTSSYSLAHLSQGQYVIRYSLNNSIQSQLIIKL